MHLQEACMYAPLPEVQSAIGSPLDIPGLAGTQFLCQEHRGEDEESLRIPLTVEHPSPIGSQDYSEPAPHLPWGRGVPAS